MIPELRLLVVGSNEDSYLKLYQITADMEIKVHPKVKKDSAAKVLQMTYEKELLSCLSQDNKIEYYKVSLNNDDGLLKKMVRQEKRKALKRKRKEDDEEDELPQERKVDKDAIREQIKKGEYDLSFHFSKKCVVEIDPQQKVKSFVNVWKKKKADIFVSVATNQILKYQVDLKSEEHAKQVAKIGEGCHQGAIRGIAMANNDYMMATHSFDSVNVW